MRTGRSVNLWSAGQRMYAEIRRTGPTVRPDGRSWTGRSGRLAAAAVALLLFGACHRESVESYLAAGSAATQQSRLEEAQRNYERAIRIAPDDPRAHLKLGDLYLMERKLGPAKLELMRVLELEPGNAPAHLALARVYASQGELGSAEEQNRAAVALRPSEPRYYLALGAVLEREGKTAESESAFRTAIGLRPRDARAHLALAELLRAEPGGAAKAESEYAQVRALDPGLLPAPAPSASPAASAAPVPPQAGAASGAAPPFRPIRRRFLLTRNAAVREAPDGSSRVLGRVRKGRRVQVTGITGDWLQVRLRSGTVGFIPVSAAE